MPSIPKPKPNLSLYSCTILCPGLRATTRKHTNNKVEQEYFKEAKIF